MLSISFILYNILRSNKSIISWLNLYLSEGLTTGMLILLADVILYILVISKI